MHLPSMAIVMFDSAAFPVDNNKSIGMGVLHSFLQENQCKKYCRCSQTCHSYLYKSTPVELCDDSYDLHIGMDRK